MSSPSPEVCKLCWVSTHQRGCGAPGAQSCSWTGRTGDIIFTTRCKMKMWNPLLKNSEFQDKADQQAKYRALLSMRFCVTAQIEHPGSPALWVWGRPMGDMHVSGGPGMSPAQLCRSPGNSPPLHVFSHKTGPCYPVPFIFLLWL